MKKNKNLKTVLIGLAVFFGFQKVFSKTKSNKFHSINSNNQFRNCDAWGCGYFGASRGGKEHKGIDFKVYENEPIKAPFDCEIIRYGYPYTDNSNFRLVEIKGLNSFSNYTAKIMYIKIIHNLGTIITKGNTICKADDISKKFDNRMTNHVHFELYKNGILINPETFFE